jgi:signal transduction histidine kinase
MKRFPRPFRGLRGKLTLSYTLTSVVTFLTLELLVLGVAFAFVSLNIQTFVVSALKQEAPLAAPYFVHGSPDREALASWVRLVDSDVFSQGPLNHFNPIFVMVVNTQGQAIAAVSTPPIPVDNLVQTQLSAQDQANLRAVLDDARGATSRAGTEADGTLVAMTPIMSTSSDRKVLGALAVKMPEPDRLQLLWGFLGAVLVSVTFVTAIAAIAGAVFGYLIARGLTRRLKGLFTAAGAWSRGDFSAATDDSSDDELGQLARQLNHMAEQLQNLLQTGQKLATLEERNRLARDLHDSVKQQVFAVAMQIGATRVLLRRDIEAAEVRLNEADRLVRQAQEELTALIRELRPAALEGKSLVAALRELAVQWAQQTNIVTNLHVEGTQAVPPAVEEAFYRVAQEALANVDRHGKATLVQMVLTIADDSVTLTVSDNGQGFDTTRQGSSGLGLLSMQERMKALGGEVQLESASGQGTRVTAQAAVAATSANGGADARLVARDRTKDYGAGKALSSPPSSIVHRRSSATTPDPDPKKEQP